MYRRKLPSTHGSSCPYSYNAQAKSFLSFLGGGEPLDTSTILLVVRVAEQNLTFHPLLYGGIEMENWCSDDSSALAAANFFPDNYLVIFGTS
jgi:hypothetical protein